MPRLQIITTNFTAGEFSPLLAGRVDVEKYNSSAKELTNVVVLKQGGVTIRPPLTYLGPAKPIDGAHRLIPFVYSRTDAFQLEFGNLYIRFRRASDDTPVEVSPGVPYEIPSPFLASQVDAIDFSQGEDTMILVHGDHPPQRLRRFADARWVLDAAPFAPTAVSEVGNQAAVTMTISNTAVGTGRTITASGAFFLASDVGRDITWDGGTARITAFGSSTSVTADVTSAFASAVGYPAVNLGPVWTLMGSPLTTLTPSAATPVGLAITLTLAAAGWRDDTGSLVELNGGLVRITSVASPTVANAVILRELTSATPAASDAWVVLRPIWSVTRGYPKTVSFYQQRLWFGNTVTYPQSLWGSRTGLYYDFTPGTDDDSAVYKTAAATDEVNPLTFLCGGASQVMLGYGAELEGKGGIEKPITQTNMQINAQSEWGCAQVRPMTVGKEILFVERGGKTVRALFPQQVDGYDSSDVSVFSDHLLADGIKAISFERKPNAVLWVATLTGKLLAFTYNREQNTIAWAGGSTDGFVESLSTVPSATGDVTHAIVIRQINGVSVRYIERLDWRVGPEEPGAYDCRIKKLFMISTTNPTGFDALEGREVAVLADGIYIGMRTVVGGAFTLNTEARQIAVGLPYTARVVLPPPEVGTGTGTSSGQAKSTSSTMVRVYQSTGMLVNGDEVAFRKFDEPLTLDNPAPLFTGLKSLTNVGWSNDDDESQDLTLEQTQGLPWTVLAVIRTITVNAG